MRTLVTLGAAVLLYAGTALAQQIPPGPDTLGSSPGSVHSQQPPTAPTTNHQQNQQTTGTMGSTTGYNRNPDYAGSPPNPARGAQGHNPTAAQTAPGQKARKSKAKSSQPAAKNHSKKQSRKGTGRKHTPPAAGDSLPSWTEPSDDQPDAVTPLSRTLVLIKA